MYWKMHQQGRRQIAFTIIELLVVIAIIGILATIVIVSLRGGAAKARDSKVKSKAAQIDKAIAQYEIDNNQFFPLALSQVDTTDASMVAALITSGYLKTNDILTPNAGKTAKYISDLSRKHYAQAWELETVTEASITTGNGVYTTDSSNTAGAVSAPVTNANAVNYNRVNQYANIPHNAAFNFAGNFSVSFWAKTTGSNVNGDALVEKWAGGGGYPFAFRYNSNNSVSFFRYDGTTSAGAAGPVTQPINSGGTDGWHHIVGIKNGNNTTIVIDNGTPITNSTVIGSANNSIAIFVGSRGGSSQFFGGSIDDLRIYNTNLTTGSGSQVEALYNSGRGKFGGSGESSLVALWQMDEGTGTTLTNNGPSTAISPPSAVNGTLINSGTNSWTAGIVPLGLTGIGSSLTGRAFVTNR